MKNKADDLYGYNDTISAMISKMCLDAYAKYDTEKELETTKRQLEESL